MRGSSVSATPSLVSRKHLASRKAPALPLLQRVVFVHGIWQNESRSFGTLRHALEAQGVECIAPSLVPSDARRGLQAHAEQLKAAIDARFGENERVVIIAFSMGGLVSRYYLQEMGGASRCDALFTISSPHHGAGIARFWGGRGSRQMRPGSAFLKELAATEERLAPVPTIVSYHTAADLVVPPSRSIWDRAENVRVNCILHQFMTACPEVKDDICRRFRLPGEQAVSRGW